MLPGSSAHPASPLLELRTCRAILFHGKPPQRMDHPAGHEAGRCSAGLVKPACAHTLRLSSLRKGLDIRTVQAVFGDEDVRTTMIHMHVLNRGGRGVAAPQDV
ncbi:MAG: hypothetical protein F9K30_21790 [Dechloromonas sp.]|nr:MAG: hypothetical protein F9K30_21790 [Dechloromonas sp.]